MQSNLEGMSILSLVHSRKHTFVNSKGHCGSDQTQTQVGHHGDDGDILDGKEDDQHRSKSNPGITGILPVKKMFLDFRGQPHLVADFSAVTGESWSCWAAFMYSSRMSAKKSETAVAASASISWKASICALQSKGTLFLHVYLEQRAYISFSECYFVCLSQKKLCNFSGTPFLWNWCFFLITLKKYKWVWHILNPEDILFRALIFLSKILKFELRISKRDAPMYLANILMYSMQIANAKVGHAFLIIYIHILICSIGEESNI